MTGAQLSYSGQQIRDNSVFITYNEPTVIRPVKEQHGMGNWETPEMQSLHSLSLKKCEKHYVHPQ